MSKEIEYRAFAASCLEMASKTSDGADNTRLLAMAEAWLDLAERARRLARQPTAADIPDHPMVAETLRRYTESELE